MQISCAPTGDRATVPPVNQASTTYGVVPSWGRQAWGCPRHGCSWRGRAAPRPSRPAPPRPPPCLYPASGDPPASTQPPPPCAPWWSNFSCSLAPDSWIWDRMGTRRSRKIAESCLVLAWRLRAEGGAGWILLEGQAMLVPSRRVWERRRGSWLLGECTSVNKRVHCSSLFLARKYDHRPRHMAISTRGSLFWQNKLLFCLNFHERFHWRPKRLNSTNEG